MKRNIAQQFQRCMMPVRHLLDSRYDFPDSGPQVNRAPRQSARTRTVQGRHERVDAFATYGTGCQDRNVKEKLQGGSIDASPSSTTFQ